LLQALRKVDGVTHERVLRAFLAADEGRHDQSRREANAELEWGQSRGLPSPVQLELAQVHRLGDSERAPGVVGLRFRGAEYSHDRVAHELHDCATLGEDGIAGYGSELLQLARQVAGVRSLRDRRVAAHIGDQERPDLGLVAPAWREP